MGLRLYIHVTSVMIYEKTEDTDMNEKVIAFGAFHPVPSFLFLMSLIVIAVFMANPVAVGILDEFFTENKQ